jgi:hypothetical protein
MRSVRSSLLPLLVVALAACAHEQAASRAPAVAEAAPEVVVDAARLGATREDACARVADREVKDHAAEALAAGMLAGDYEGFRRAVKQKHFVATFRDGNPACLPHLAAGVQSKAHDILQKTWDASNLKPADQHLAGLVSDLWKKPPKGVLVDDPKLTLKDGEPLTCDYDLMDLLEEGGQRIPGETPRDLEARAALNAELPATAMGHRDRVMHGAQAAYADYFKLHPEEKEIVILYKPEAPLTAMAPDRRAWHLESVEDALNFYRCRGTGLPARWRVSSRAADGALTPLR